ncbi:MAG: peptidoglycan-binding domain-containing protein [Kiloniellales bacterium]|nr:peptidoglycan-binding domain-containing protein [Kiloniellales bacterium]
MMRSIIAVGLAASLFLSACGSDTGDRAASGAGIGAGAGAVLGAVTGLSILEGVLIGAAAGGLIGGLTDEEVINLGDPIWEDDDQPPNKSAVTRVQAGLAQLGYNPGPVDGRMGSQTRTAIKEYQRDHGLLVDGRASVELARHIEGQVT